MRRLQNFALVATLAISVAIAPSARAKTAIAKPSAPTIASVSSSAAKKGKVNITVTIALPTSDGGSAIAGSNVTAGGKSCTMKKSNTSCTIKGFKVGKSLNITASSKNKKGFGPKSAAATHIAGGISYTRHVQVKPAQPSIVPTVISPIPMPSPSSTCADMQGILPGLAASYALTISQATEVTSGVCFNEISKTYDAKQRLVTKAQQTYPGLGGNISVDITTSDFVAYYIRNVQHGLELAPYTVSLSDPLISSWLQSGFPANSSNLGVAIRTDSRYQNTWRYDLDLMALSSWIKCSWLGDQNACASARSTDLQIAALGPFIVS